MLFCPFKESRHLSMRGRTVHGEINSAVANVCVRVTSLDCLSTVGSCHGFSFNEWSWPAAGPFSVATCPHLVIGVERGWRHVDC